MFKKVLFDDFDSMLLSRLKNYTMLSLNFTVNVENDFIFNQYFILIQLSTSEGRGDSLVYGKGKYLLFISTFLEHSG